MFRLSVTSGERHGLAVWWLLVDVKNCARNSQFARALLFFFFAIKLLLLELSHCKKYAFYFFSLLFFFFFFSSSFTVTDMDDQLFGR